ncbi:hypothetical protein Moror_10671 [Moniliophthora roreri MCA 2997]|uniref:MYND-type domain-containing protein n=1 Tax=Moniliophthora roreri (strain MCA 2997) TaxID=1381753 RepID=V2XDB2_MONRO|nr:hypothetical protein Moror_10671 [Moniliophthora roreri MCA 2997]
MDSSTEEKLFDVFLLNAKRRFSSTRKAITALQQLDQPPSNVSFCNVLHPSDQVHAALEAIAVLGELTPLSEQALGGPRRRRFLDGISLVKSNWTKIGLWIKFFFDVAVEKPFTSSETLIELGLTRKILFTLPNLLLYPTACEDQETEVQDLIRRAPYTPRLGARVWVKLLRDMHTGWVSWSGLFVGLLFASGSNEPLAHFVDELKIIRDSEGVDTALLAIRCMRHVSQLIRSNCISRKDFAGFHTTMTLFVCCCIRRSVFPGFHVSFITQGGVAQLVSTLKVLISHHDNLRFIRRGSGQFGDLTATIMAIQSGLQEALDGVQAVSDALEAGLILVMFKTQRYYNLECDEPNSFTPNPPSKVWDSFANLLQRISLYMVYPAVLRRFWRSMNTITSSFPDLEHSIQWSAERRLRMGWEQCKNKATSFRVMYELMKMPTVGKSLCSNSECPLKLSPWMRSSNLRYQRCSACLCVAYCSRTCSKANWIASHRNNCAEYSRAFREGHPHESDIDRALFVSITKLYCVNHKDDIREKLASFTPSGADEKEQGRDTDTDPGQPYQRGVVVLAFYNINRLDFNSSDCTSIMHLKDVYNDRRLAREQSDNLVRKASQVQDSEMLVVAFFPATTRIGDLVLTVIEILNLPQVTSSDEEDREDEFYSDLEPDF